MNVHFIAIGGSAMHNLAISLCKKGYQVTGSDDEIFEPSRGRLEKYNILPEEIGWNPDKIHRNLDAVILGMHARNDNPELQKARKLNLNIYSYPEYLYEQTKNKIRVVIGGSHGKTTITSMIMHVLKYHHKKFDYMVGAQIEGFETMVSLTDDAPLAVFEGDEYLSSPIDPRPKFHLYKPHIAVISGIAWDHINVFPTFDEYKKQFSRFIDLIEPKGTLFYYQKDPILNKIVEESTNTIHKTAYNIHHYNNKNGQTFLLHKTRTIPVKIFGEHNLQNISAAKLICNQLAISDHGFYDAISTFKGASKRLELIAQNESTLIYKDFAHSPSKLKATVNAVKNQYPEKKLIAVMELHTFSSLSINFLQEYKGSMNKADIPVVYFNQKVIRHKKLKPISKEKVVESFANHKLTTFTMQKQLIKYIKNIDITHSALLFMSSGDFSGLNINAFAHELLNYRHQK
ncbi:MAG TPA: Mur ligase family protein [Bacteroidales bacterium]|nr:Mur ligase family protein [Bacteroidales bacterium]